MTPWEHDPREDEALLASAVAVVEFARSQRARLHPEHPRRLMNDAVWFLTERGSPSRKYQLRFRTPAALEFQTTLGMGRAARQLAHEHVHERAHVIAMLLADDEVDVRAILSAAQACVVTRSEHQALTATGLRGWKRYLAAGLTPVDLMTGEPADLPRLAATDPLA